MSINNCACALIAGLRRARSVPALQEGGGPLQGLAEGDVLCEREAVERLLHLSQGVVRRAPLTPLLLLHTTLLYTVQHHPLTVIELAAACAARKSGE